MAMFRKVDAKIKHFTQPLKKEAKFDVKTGQVIELEELDEDNANGIAEGKTTKRAEDDSRPDSSNC